MEFKKMVMVTQYTKQKQRSLQENQRYQWNISWKDGHNKDNSAILSTYKKGGDIKLKKS